MRFTGGDNLSGFNRLVHNVFMKNELNNGEGAYEISYCKAGRSGYSFGPVQWDLKSNPAMRQGLFTDILTNAKDSNGNIIIDLNTRNSILNHVAGNGSLSPGERNLVNQALSSSYGVQKINEAYLTDLDTAISKIDGVINKVTDPEDKAFLQTDLGRLFLIDYNNQFNISSNGPMEKFLQGQEVELSYGKKVSIKGDLGIEDLLNFYLTTKYGQDHPADLIRRFSNDLEELGINNICLTQEDAKFLAENLQGMLGKNYFSIIYNNPDNWGMRELIFNACTLFHYGWNYFMFGHMLDIVHQSFTTAITAAPPAPRGCPLVLDLDGDGIETTSLNDGSYFDHDANGFAEKTGWVASDDGLLVMDRNGDRIVNDGKELFGDQTILKSGTKAANGFQALADLDDNKDGKIDANDSAFSQLRVWQDFDGDGYSSGDELYTLNELGIAALNTGYTNSNTTDSNGNIRMLAGTFKRPDGTTNQMDDFSFRRDTTYTIANEWLDVPADTAALPDLQGYGNVYDLQQAMVRDSSGQLKSLVEQFIAATDPSVCNSLMDQILFKWTGSDGINPTSRGPNIDARKLAVLEKFFAQAFVGVSGANPNATAGGLLNQSYRGIFEMFYAGLMAQTHLKDLYDKITYTWDDTTQSLKGDLGNVKTELENRYGVDPISGETVAGEFIRSIKGFQAETMLGLDTFRSNRTFSWLMDSYGPPSQIDGTSANDTLVGTAGADGIRGGGGNDTISGGDGNDVLYGGPGDDVIDGGSGADTLIGGPGNDTLGGAYVSNDWYGYGGGNTYEGGLGNDTLRGTCAGDLYKFNLGDGQDVVVEPNWSGVVGTDILRFGLGIVPSDIKVVRSGNDLVFRHVNGVDKVTVQGWYLNGYTQLERIEFADGTVWSGASVHAQGLVVSGTEGNDTLSGVDAYGDTLYGLGGNDTLYGYGGNDILDGGPGDDVIDGGSGADTLIGGPGNDTLGGAYGSNDWYGYGGGNTYEGGLGNDTLRGTMCGRSLQI